MNTTQQTAQTDHEPSDYPQGWYHCYVDYATGHKPAVCDLSKLADCLPHGSGIDGDWHIKVARNGDVLVTGEYHNMDDNGYYCGWKSFRFAIRRATKNEYTKLKGPCEGQCQITKARGRVYLTSFVGGGDAGDYLYDMVSCALADEMGICAISSDVVMSEDAARAFSA